MIARQIEGVLGSRESRLGNACFNTELHALPTCTRVCHRHPHQLGIYCRTPSAPSFRSRLHIPPPTDIIPDFDPDPERSPCPQYPHFCFLLWFTLTGVWYGESALGANRPTFCWYVEYSGYLPAVISSVNHVEPWNSMMRNTGPTASQL